MNEKNYAATKLRREKIEKRSDLLRTTVFNKISMCLRGQNCIINFILIKARWNKRLNKKLNIKTERRVTSMAMVRGLESSIHIPLDRWASFSEQKKKKETENN